MVMNVNGQENNIINTKDLIFDFSQNETEFVKKYTGKRIKITGKIFSKYPQKRF